MKYRFFLALLLVPAAAGLIALQGNAVATRSYMNCSGTLRNMHKKLRASLQSFCNSFFLRGTAPDPNPCRDPWADQRTAGEICRCSVGRIRD